MNSRLLPEGTFWGFATNTKGVAPSTAIGVKSPGISKGRFLMTLGKITTLLETTDSVKPSGGFLAMACKPITPLAPAWFSTTTLAPKALPMAGAAARVIASTPEPVALGKMNLTGRSACANDRPGKADAAADVNAAKAARRVKLFFMMCLFLFRWMGYLQQGTERFRPPP